MHNINPNDATLHLLSRHSGDTSPMSYTPDSLSDYYDEYEYKTPSHSLSRRNRLTRLFSTLTSRPLFWHTRRKFKGRIPRLLVFVVNISLITLLWAVVYSLIEAVFRPSYSNPPKHYAELEERLHKSEQPGRGNVRGEKVFIASNIIQADMIRGPWGANLIKLVDYLGPENVFVSIYENDSGPETTLALSWLRDQLNCEHIAVFMRWD
jgi:hypothetical protein